MKTCRFLFIVQKLIGIFVYCSKDDPQTAIMLLTNCEHLTLLSDFDQVLIVSTFLASRHSIEEYHTKMGRITSTRRAPKKSRCRSQPLKKCLEIGESLSKARERKDPKNDSLAYNRWSLYDYDRPDEWTSYLEQNPEGLWMSHDWISANRVPQLVPVEIYPEILRAELAAKSWVA